MKKIMLFAAACVALAACTKNIDTTTPEIGKATSFEKGQKVTLTVNTGDQTKVTSELVTSGTDKDKVNFKWETGDKIKVTVGTESAEFTLTSGAGEATAQFTGTMPAAGDNFDVQYPVEDPVLTTQTYSSTEAIPHNMLKFTASNCSVGTAFTMNAANAALRLNFYADVTIGKIVVTDKTASPEVSYTLNCTDGVKNNTGNETMPFIIVLPAGSRNFEAKVYGTGDTPSLICTRTTTSAQTFVNGEILNMPLKYDYLRTDMDKITIGTTAWAPVNCGYEPANGEYIGYIYGKLYQWGRKYGQGYYKAGSGSTPTYEDATYPSGANLATGPISDIQEASAEKFYTITEKPYNWYSGSSPAANDLWKEDGSSIYDPCPEGWRVPTKSELTALMGSHTGGDLQDGSGIYSGMKGKYLDGSSTAVPTSGLFLPAAGYRGYGVGSAYDRGGSGRYWSSSVDGNSAWFWYFGSGYANGTYGNRADGYSVRCVQE